MTNAPFPGFNEDEPQPAKPAKPAPARAPAAAAPQYELDMGSDEEAPKPKKAYVPPVEDAPAPAPAPAPVAAARSKVPAPVADTVPDEDIKPGSRKDLWACPHCGTKNQPQRTTCRSCGKSPDDEVVVPLHKKPAFLAGIGAAVVLLIVLLIAMSGADLALREPSPEAVDTKLRLGSQHGEAREVAGHQFTPTGTLAVCGRIAAVTQANGVTSVALALGKAASDDETFQALTTTIGDGRMNNPPDPSELLHLVFPGTPPALGKGAFLSLVGERGALADVPGLDGGTVVVVSESRQ
jgi:hypothetical protein